MTTGKKTVEQRLLTVRQTAEFLGFSVRSLYNRVSPGAKNPFPVKPKRIGRSVRFDRRDLEEYVNSL